MMLKAAVIMAAVLAMSVAPMASAQEVPTWVMGAAKMWGDGQTSDSEFLNAIAYLVENRIITVSQAGMMATQDQMTIGFIPSEKADTLTPKAEALASYLESKMPGTSVDVVVPSDYETIIEGLKFGHIDAAVMDTGPGWIAHNRAGADVIMAEVVSGKINYQATVWAKAGDDSVQSLEDTLGKRVAFTSITGSSGFVRPMGTLVTSGAVQVDGGDLVALNRALDTAFESYTFAGGYKAALTLLLEDKVDVAFGSDIAPAKYLEPEQQRMLRAVTTVGPVPSHVVVVSGDMDMPTRKALTDALTGLNYGPDNSILQDLYGAEALLPTDTEAHIGEFGQFIDALSGLDQKILDKYNKAK